MKYIAKPIFDGTNHQTNMVYGLNKTVFSALNRPLGTT